MEETKTELPEVVLRRMTLRHADDELVLTADAYRGSALKECLQDFEAAAASGEHALVAFIGHNGLMDFELPEPEQRRKTHTDAVVLCCKSERYFSSRLEKLGCRPILLTTQFMYPGAFILHDAIEVWRGDGTLSAIRDAAANAYAKNQKISLRAAAGVFAEIPDVEQPSQPEPAPIPTTPR